MDMAGPRSPSQHQYGFHDHLHDIVHCDIVTALAMHANEVDINI